MHHYTNTDEIREANQRAGQHWFSADTVRFFRSRIGSTVYGGRYFVSSEQYDWDAPRRYTVRVVDDSGYIDTVGEFQQYETRAQAVSAARTLAVEGT